MANTRTDAIAIARSKRGVMESPPGSNRCEFSAWYGMVGPWCAMFLSWVLWKVGNKEYRFASTAASVAAFRRAGKLRPVGQARPGDILVRLYTATTGHTGMCAVNEGASIVTLEGNTGGSDRDGGAVMERRRDTSFWHYCLAIEYTGQGSTPPQNPPQAGGLVVDGNFGPSTIKALQARLNATGANPRLAEDGDYGTATKRMLQARLNHVAGPVAIDGDVGPQTIKALQRHVGATVDGSWGPQTTRKLQEALNAGRF